jgi:hypothetical protein
VCADRARVGGVLSDAYKVRGDERQLLVGTVAVNTRVAEAVEGVRLIDPTPVACTEKKCPAVIGDVLVYRNGAHLTATYVRTLIPWLGERLPEPADQSS